MRTVTGSVVTCVNPKTSFIAASQIPNSYSPLTLPSAIRRANLSNISPADTPNSFAARSTSTAYNGPRDATANQVIHGHRFFATFGFFREPLPRTRHCWAQSLEFLFELHAPACASLVQIAPQHGGCPGILNVVSQFSRFPRGGQ
jgi:hypothetical protein